jgi:hypothetical protein
MVNANAAALVEKIGNVVTVQIVDGVIYTLSQDANIRVNDEDTGLNVHRVIYPSLAAAELAFNELVSTALAHAQAGE